MNQHDPFIRRAFALAKQSVQNGNHPFGAVLVIAEEIVLEGENTVIETKDVTHHAEMNLISRASRIIPGTRLKEATLYASTEPCAMCTGALYWSGIRHLVYGCSSESLDKIAGGGLVSNCRQILGLGQEPSIVVGPYLEDEACVLHRSYW